MRRRPRSGAPAGVRAGQRQLHAGGDGRDARDGRPRRRVVGGLLGLHHLARELPHQLLGLAQRRREALEGGRRLLQGAGALDHERVVLCHGRAERHRGLALPALRRPGLGPSGASRRCGASRRLSRPRWRCWRATPGSPSGQGSPARVAAPAVPAVATLTRSRPPAATPGPVPPPRNRRRRSRRSSTTRPRRGRPRRWPRGHAERGDLVLHARGGGGPARRHLVERGRRGRRLGHGARSRRWRPARAWSASVRRPRCPPHALDLTKGASISPISSASLRTGCSALSAGRCWRSRPRCLRSWRSPGSSAG